MTGALHPPGWCRRKHRERIAAQKAGALDQVVRGFTLAHHNSAQTQRVTTVSFVDKDSGHQSTDSAKAVKHDILRLIQWLGLRAQVVSNFLDERTLQWSGLRRHPCRSN